MIREAPAFSAVEVSLSFVDEVGAARENVLDGELVVFDPEIVGVEKVRAEFLFIAYEKFNGEVGKDRWIFGKRERVDALLVLCDDDIFAGFEEFSAVAVV